MPVCIQVLIVQDGRGSVAPLAGGRMATSVRILRYAGVIWLVSLIRHLYLIGAGLGEDQRTNIIKTHVYKRLDYLFKLY